MLYGTAELDPQAEMVAQLAQEMYHQNMLYMLVENLNKIDFEVRHSSFVVRHRILLIKLRFIIGGLLESPWWLLLAFCPKILGGSGDLQIIHLLLIWMQLEWCGQSKVVGTLKPYLLFKKNWTFCTLRQQEYKNFSTEPSPSTSHLEEFLLPYYYILIIVCLHPTGKERCRSDI